MKFYLSSYELGNKTEELKNLVPNGKIAYIGNARDFTAADPEMYIKRSRNDIDSLSNLGLQVEMLDLRDYFGKENQLKEKLSELNAIFISGGNVFILRQAMKLSGLDEILKEFKHRDNFLYAGYSAAGCVLSEDLHAYAIVDDATDTPYEGLKETIWEGLGFIDFAFMPHYDSDHPESVDINKEVEYCKEHNIPYKGVKDGEVIIF
jgi:dipeptidase E